MKDFDRRERLKRVLEDVAQGKFETPLSSSQIARLAGESILDETTVGTSIGQKHYSRLKAKRDVHPALLWQWREARKARRKSSREPFTHLFKTIRSTFLRISRRLAFEASGDAQEDEWEDHPSGIDHYTEIWANKEAFEPFSGLAWYALELDRKYHGALRHLRQGNVEVGAFYAFEAGKLYSELQAMEALGEFVAKSVETKTKQRDAGLSSAKVSKEVRRSKYLEFRKMGDKKTIAAQNAAQELGVSLSTIRNAFPNSRLPD